MSASATDVTTARRGHGEGAGGPAAPGAARRGAGRLGAVAAWVRRRPVGAYLVWFFTVGWAPAFLPAVARNTLGIDLPPWADQLCIIAVTVFGMFLPAVVITRVADGPEGARQLLRRTLKTRVSVGWYAFALLAIPVAAVVSALIVYGPPAAAPSTLLAAIVSGLLLQTFVHLLTNNLWEEVAVMGFVQARLQARHGAMRAAALTALVFALQHLPLQSGTATELGLYVLLATAVFVPFRALVAWVYNRTGSLFIAGLLHAAGNAAAVGSGFGDPLLERLYENQSVGLMHVLGTALVGLAVIAATRARLGYQGDSGSGARA